MLYRGLDDRVPRHEVPWFFEEDWEEPGPSEEDRHSTVDELACARSLLWQWN